MYYRYNDAAAVRTARVVDKPISAVRMKDGTIRCILKQGQSLVLDIDLTERKTLNSMVYFPVTPDDHPVPFTSDAISEYLLLLPCLGEGGSSFYSVVRSDWKEMDKDGEFGFPCTLKEKTT